MTSFQATTVAILILAILAKKTTKSETTAATTTTTIDNDNASSRLSIHIPHSLYKEEGYDHREALFGISPYGGSITENLYYADSDLCDATTVDTRKGYPTREIDGKDGTMRPWPSPYILMVDRGGCTFVQKVRNAQRSGAAGVIIADNTCLCNDLNCTTTTSHSPPPCQATSPSMGDDGSGTDITIPSFLMFKTDADIIKNHVKNNNQIVQIEMAWSLPSPDDRVEYDLWTLPSERFSEPFIDRFRSVAARLGNRAYFTPYMYFIDGTTSGCCRDTNNDPDRYEGCDRVCTNGGRYCAIDPEIETDVGISGHDVILESLRRICIWRHYGEADGVGVVWWDYANEFRRRCDGSDDDDGDDSSSSLFADDDCIRDVYRRAGVDERVVDQCIRDSGGVSSDRPNVLLDAELEAQSRRGVVRLPSVFVNTVALQGALTVGNVFGAICAGYLAGTEPEICVTCAVCLDKVSCAMEGECKMGGVVVGDGGTNVSFFLYCFSMMVVVGVFGGVGVLYYRWNRERMREQVRGILAEYVPLEDQEVNANGCNGVNPSLEFAQRYGNTRIL